MKRLAILTSGGDCSGMNATIRAAARTAIANDVEMIGYRKGFAGLLKNDFIVLDTKSVSGTLQRGGTFLQSARSQEFRTEEGRKNALDNLLREKVEGLIVIGGDGSLNGALALDRMGFPVIGIPASIDNDIPYTDMALGVDTALNNIIYAVDCIKDTANSHDRAFIVEVMGRNSGYLASTAAIATGAEFAIVPEVEFDLSEMCQQLRRRYEEGRTNALIIMAEGAGHAQEIADSLKNSVGFETRVTVLGHYQRGGAPSVFDRLLGSRFGRKAVELLIHGTKGVMVGLAASSLTTTLLEMVATGGQKKLNQDLLRMADILGIEMKRRKHYSAQSRKAGLPPGTLVHTGTLSSTGTTTINVLTYSADSFQEYRPENFDQCVPLKGSSDITWINVDGLQDVELIRHFGECYNLHPLALEDIVNTTQRPKIEDYGEYIFIVIRMIRFNQDQSVETEQVSLILGPGYVLSFQEGIEGDVFEPIRERIRTGRGRLRTLGSDYLAYALIDAVVDSCFAVLEGMGEIVEDLEEELAEGPTQQILKRIINLKREIIFIRKSVWPLREVIGALERGESDLVSDTSRLYFRDIYDHTIQVIDGVETFRDLLSGMLDLYLSSISNRTNEVMKFLTVVGTIFLPLTFLVGVYGMNFKHMPELEWRNGYYGLWIFMVALSVGMILYFKKKRWL